MTPQDGFVRPTEAPVSALVRNARSYNSAAEDVLLRDALIRFYDQIDVEEIELTQDEWSEFKERVRQDQGDREFHRRYG